MGDSEVFPGFTYNVLRGSISRVSMLCHGVGGSQPCHRCIRKKDDLPGIAGLVTLLDIPDYSVACIRR